MSSGQENLAKIERQRRCSKAKIALFGSVGIMDVAVIGYEIAQKHEVGSVIAMAALAYIGTGALVSYNELQPRPNEHIDTHTEEEFKFMKRSEARQNRGDQL